MVKPLGTMHNTLCIVVSQIKDKYKFAERYLSCFHVGDQTASKFMENENLLQSRSGGNMKKLPLTSKNEFSILHCC